MSNLRSSSIVGIDLGTTYSSLAYVDPQGVPRVVGDAAGRTALPSAVYFDDLGVVVGHEALRRATLHADRVVQFVKLHMGEAWTREYHGHVHTPESISALILRQLVSEAEARIGPIDDAVITVPAYFTERRRRATQQAGEIAGLNVVGMLNEPMAAALAYGLYRAAGERNVVVYDLGGGTFDVTVVHVGANRIEELSILGNRQLGGCDWDRCLVDFVADDFQRVHQVDPRESEQALVDMQITCEAGKRQLSKVQQTSIKFTACGREHSVDVTRSVFESLTEHLIETTRTITETAVADAGLHWDQIERVVLVGGSTLMPAVRTMVRKLAGKAPDTSVNPVLAVSLGASVFAHMLEQGTAFDTKPTVVLEKESESVAPASPLPPPTDAVVAVPAVPPIITAPPIAAPPIAAPPIVAPPIVTQPIVATPSVPPPIATAGQLPLVAALADPEPPAPVSGMPTKTDSTNIWSDVPHVSASSSSADQTDDDQASLTDDVDPEFPATIAFDPTAVPEPAKQPAASKSFEMPRITAGAPLPNVGFVTAHGVGVLLKKDDGFVNNILIPKNSPVPVKTSRTYRTTGSTGMQTNVKVTITQGDTTDADLAEILGEGRIHGLPPGQNANRPVDVILEFDRQGRLHVHAVYVDTGNQLQMTLDVVGGLKAEALDGHRDYLARTPFLPTESNNIVEEEFVFVDPEDDDL